MADQCLIRHHRDDAIKFDKETHSYYVDGKKMTISVTGLVHQYFPGFNAELGVTMMLKGKMFPYESKHQRYHTLPIWADHATHDPIEAWKEGAVLRDTDEAKKIILALWSKSNTESSASGTNLHQQIEDYIKDEKIPEELSVEFGYFLDYHQQMLDKGYKAYQSEQMVYDVYLQLAGCVDMLYIKDGKIYLTDWKRSKEILWNKSFNGKVESGIGPMSEHPNCNGLHYSLQLNIYRELLEKHYGIEISDMSIVVFHPSNAVFHEYKIKDLRKEVREIFDLRMKFLENP